MKRQCKIRGLNSVACILRGHVKLTQLSDNRVISVLFTWTIKNVLYIPYVCHNKQLRATENGIQAILVTGMA